MKMAGTWEALATTLLTAAGCSGKGQAFLGTTSSPRPSTATTSAAVPPPPARHSPVSERTVKDIVVEQALFGSGTKLVDVTDRVVQLLRSEPQGFKAEADWLRVDPVPGKTKSLWIRYVYQDTPRMFMVTLNNRASYKAMTADPAVK